MGTPTPAAPSGLLTLPEVARAIGKATGRKPHHATIHRWVQRGRLKATRVGSRWYVDASDIADVVRPPAPNHTRSNSRGVDQATSAVAAMLGRPYGNGDDAELITTMYEEERA